MARAKANKLYRTFVKGLVTEASPLTYPEDASRDELNTILSRDGKRTRRRGINYLANTLTASMEVTDDSISQSEFVWKAVAQKADLNFMVKQIGFNVDFFDLSSKISATSKKSFSIDLSTYVLSSWNTVDAERVTYQMDAGKGYLFIVGRAIEPLVVEYDEDADDITVTPITIRIRDFDGLDDGLANSEEPTTLSKEHHYNLMNQGWLYGTSSTSTFSPVTFTGYVYDPEMEEYSLFRSGELITVYNNATPSNSPIFKFYDEVGRYPGNNKQWWVARAEADNEDEGIEAGDFLPKILNKLYSGNNRAPKGHFILNAFSKNRTQVSGISNIETETLDYRPEAITFFSGRGWYAAGSVVYYSQILDSTGVYKAGLCYQEADPTAEDISEIIASDGGVVPIPEANRIRKLLPMANGVLVFAQNGVWFISGGDASFSAVNLSVSKISSIGTKSPMAAIEVNESIFWWSETGIDALQQASGQFGPIPGKFGNSSVSEQTIQSLFTNIPEASKQYAKVVYDNRNNRILWLYDSTGTYRHKYDSVLLYDLTLQAFFPWKFSSIVNGPTVSGFYNNVGESFATDDNTVIDSGGDTVQDAALEDVVVPSLSEVYTPTDIDFTVNVPSAGMAIATTTDSGYVDWSSFDGTGVVYDSYVETGYELMNDAMRDKQAIYVFCYFTRQDNSSCRLITKWDWSNDSASNRYSNSFEAYRERNRPAPSTADLQAFEVVTTKNKVRGSGKAIQFRFGTNEAGKNFELLGWSVAFIGNTEA